MSKIRPSFVADGHGEAIQGVLKPTVAQKMTLSGLPNARTSVDLTTMIVEVTPTVACNFDIGDASIVAKSGEGFYLAANVPQLFNENNAANCA